MTGFEEAEPGSIVYLWTRGVVWTCPELLPDFGENRSRPFQWMCSSLCSQQLYNLFLRLITMQSRFYGVYFGVKLWIYRLIKERKKKPEKEISI
jgi:hypothetical protein